MERWFYRDMDIDKKQILNQSCLLCDSKKIQPLWNENKYIALHCKNCGVIFCPIFGDIFSYDKEYFNRWYIKIRFKRKRYLEKLFRRIEKVIHIPSGKLLDIGCGTGLLLEIMKEKHHEVHGIDTSLFIRDYCKDKNFNIMCCELINAGYPSSSFDVITVFDVIAHLQNPVSYLKEIRRILKNNGILIIKTPYHPTILFKLANFFRFTHKSRGVLHVPAQIFHFTPYSIKKLLFSNGFEVLYIIKANDLPAFLISFSLKSMMVFCFQLFLRIFYNQDSMIVIARNNFAFKSR